jgi:hypothetical protein
LESLKAELDGLEKRRQVLSKLIAGYEELEALTTRQERQIRERSRNNQPKKVRSAFEAPSWRS